MDYSAPQEKEFTYWLKAGFAFTLPLFAIGLILVFLLIAFQQLEEFRHAAPQTYDEQKLQFA